MSILDEVRLERPELQAPERRSRGPWIGLLLAAAVAIAAGVWYFYVRSPAATDTRVRTETEQVVVPTPPHAGPAAEPGEDILLPPLDESDPLVRELVRRLSQHPRVAAWLTTDRLVRNFTVVIANVASGQTPAQHLKAVAPGGAFQVVQRGSGVYVDPRSYARYDGHADAFAALDARGAARLYATLKPRIEEAYRELGSPHGSPDKTLERAIVELLNVPVVEGDVQLRADPVAYAYVDPSLESLSHAQRQLLRMGPRNVRLVQAKLREIAEYLGIPPSSLPAARVVRGTS